MGLFDLFRKPKAAPSARSAFPSEPTLLEILVGRYALEKRHPPEESSRSGQWWEGVHEKRRVALDQRGSHLFLYLGEPAEITEIYLVCAAPGDPPALAATRKHVERIAGAEGAAFAERFRLGATPPGALFDIPQLRIPALRDGLPKLSSSVEEVAIFENMEGLSLTLDASATTESIAADLAIAHAVLRGLEAGS
jgi:hypothetical protein